MKKTLFAVTFVLCIVSLFLFTPNGVARAAANKPNTCSYWSTDIEKTIPYQGQALNGNSVTYNWDVSILSLHDCGTGEYLGEVSDHVCLSIPAGIGWPNVNINNEGYADGLPVVVRNDVFNVSNSQPQTFCSDSGSWAVSGGNGTSVVFSGTSFDGTYIAGLHRLDDSSV